MSTPSKEGKEIRKVSIDDAFKNLSFENECFDEAGHTRPSIPTSDMLLVPKQK